MLKIAIVGCGKVADQHVQAIHRIPDCEIMALCDRELLMAKQLGERFGISKCFSDLKEMLQDRLLLMSFTLLHRPKAILLRQTMSQVGKPRLSGKTFRCYGEEAKSFIQLASSCDFKSHCSAIITNSLLRCLRCAV